MHACAIILSRDPRMHCQITQFAQPNSLPVTTIPREGNTWRGDKTHDRKEGQQVHTMGQVCAPHPRHNPSCNPRMHCRQNLLHNRTHFLRRWKHNTGGKHVANRHEPREKG